MDKSKQYLSKSHAQHREKTKKKKVRSQERSRLNRLKRFFFFSFRPKTLPSKGTRSGGVGIRYGLVHRRRAWTMGRFVGFIPLACSQLHCPRWPRFVRANFSTQPRILHWRGIMIEPGLHRCHAASLTLDRVAACW